MSNTNSARRLSLLQRLLRCRRGDESVSKIFGMVFAVVASLAGGGYAVDQCGAATKATGDTGSAALDNAKNPIAGNAKIEKGNGTNLGKTYGGK